MRTKIIFTSLIIIIALLAIISIIGIAIYKDKPETLQGQIETTEIKISGKLIGRIDKFYVREGEQVKIGDTLVMINSPETNAMLQSANAMEDIAKFQNQKVDAGARIQIIQSLKEGWEAAKANYELAATTNIRIKKLYEDSVATAQRRDEVSTLEKAAKAAEKAAYYQYQMAIIGAQKEDKQSAKAMISAAQGGVDQVQALL
ncbi:MAG: biotin/lipoyl-binding protein, partial [Bacteroidales bacterium]